jgi:hypothetical protein
MPNRYVDPLQCVRSAHGALRNAYTYSREREPASQRLRSVLLSPGYVVLVRLLLRHSEDVLG